MKDFLTILNKYGFESVPEPDSTTLAYYHEINNTLFDDDSPFDAGTSSVDTLPNTPDCMVFVSLSLKTGGNTDTAIQYLMSKWYSHLSYQNPKFERVERTNSAFGIKIEIFTIGASTACSFEFNILDDAAEKFCDEFIDFYSP